MMKIPDDAVIPMEKLTAYLLVPRVRDDKAKYLARAGFNQGNPDALLDALQRLAIGAEGVEDGTGEYGTFYRVPGELAGPNGKSLPVMTIWLRWHVDGSFHFVTLKPDRGRPS